MFDAAIHAPYESSLRGNDVGEKVLKGRQWAAGSTGQHNAEIETSLSFFARHTFD